MASAATTFILSFAKSVRMTIGDDVGFGDVMVLLGMLLCLGIVLVAAWKLIQWAMGIAVFVSKSIVIGSVAFGAIAVFAWVLTAPESLLKEDDVPTHIRWSLYKAKDILLDLSRALMASLLSLKSN